LWHRNRDVIDLVTVPCHNNVRCRQIKDGSFTREHATGTTRGTTGHGGIVVADAEAVCVMQVATSSVLHGSVSAYDLHTHMKANIPGRADSAKLPRAAHECRYVSCRPDKETLIDRVVSGQNAKTALQCFTEKFATDGTMRWHPRMVDTYTT